MSGFSEKFTRCFDSDFYIITKETRHPTKEELVELENKYNELEKNYNALQERDTNHTKTISGLNLKMNLMKEGFPSDKLEEVASLRSSMFAEEQDDSKAIGMIKEKFGATYFPKKETIEVPNEQPLGQGQVENHEIKITRNTSIKDIIK